MSGLSESELDYLEQAMQEENDDLRAYHEDQQRMLEAGTALLNQLELLELVTHREAELLRYFVR